HATNVVEHPALVAERIVRLAKLLGRENVIAGTDCGFAQGPFHRRGHPSVMWAKLEARVEGAQLASKELWTRSRDIIARSLHCCGLLPQLSSRGIHGRIVHEQPDARALRRRRSVPDLASFAGERAAISLEARSDDRAVRGRRPGRRVRPRDRAASYR